MSAWKKLQTLMLPVACLLAIVGFVFWRHHGLTSSAPICSNGTTLDVVAHEDDDILFLNPDTQKDISSGRCVTTVYLTAGQVDRTLAYALDREVGAKAAYAHMANLPDNWKSISAVYSNHHLTAFSLDRSNRVKLIFFRLPDGGSDGSGWEKYSFVSLQKLEEHKVKMISAIDGSNIYTEPDLLYTLGQIMKDFRPDIIRTQDYGAQLGTDHSDHIVAGYYTMWARMHYDTNSNILISYHDYPTTTWPVNLTATEIQQKEQTWFTYAAKDYRACKTLADCSWQYLPRLKREYIAGTIPAVYIPVQPNITRGDPAGSNWNSPTAQ